MVVFFFFFNGERYPTCLHFDFSFLLFAFFSLPFSLCLVLLYGFTAHGFTS